MTRGLIRGRWHRDVTTAPTWEADADRFQHGGFSAPIDVKALAAEPQRFHLYVAWPCPFAHRVILARAVLRLEGMIGMSVVHPWLGSPDGWFFAEDPSTEPYDGLTRDAIMGVRALHEVYVQAVPVFTGRVTVPVLWDRTTNTIASNDSAAILRALTKAFGGREGRPDLLPDARRAETDRRSAFVRDRINAGAYRAGTATTQDDYERFADAFFEACAEMDAVLDRQPFLLGDAMTEPDLLLFTTLVRLNPAYAGVLYLTHRRLDDFPALSALVERLSADQAIGDTVKEDQIRRHYFDDDGFINRRRLEGGRFIVPQGRLGVVTPRFEAAPTPPSVRTGRSGRY